jgi:hypothetical protein
MAIVVAMDTGAATPVGITAAMVADTGERLLAADTTAAVADTTAVVVVADSTVVAAAVDSTVVAAVTAVADTGNCSSVDL